MGKGYFLTVKDLMTLTGGINETSAQRSHKLIRECIKGKKRKLTIKEYCDYEGLDYKEIWAVLRQSNKIN